MAYWPLVVMILHVLAPAGASPAVPCPDHPALAPFVQQLESSGDLGEGMVFQSLACTLDYGGAYVITLGRHGGGTVALSLYAPSSHGTKAYATTNSFAVTYKTDGVTWNVTPALTTAIGLLQSADTTAVALYPSPGQGPPAGTSGGSSVPGTMVIALLLLLAAVGILAHLLTAKQWPRGTVVLLSGALLLVAAVVPYVLSSPWMALGLLVLPLGMAVAGWALRRLDRQVLLVGGLITILALVVRLVVPAGPANWYTDLAGPLDAVAPAFSRRAGGLYGLYAVIDAVIPLSSRAVLTLQALQGALAVGLVSLALAPSRAEPPGRVVGWSRYTWLAVGVLFALDPLQARLASSDAIHVTALFGASLAMAILRYLDEAGRFGMATLGALCLLPALMRSELALAPLAVMAVGLPGTSLARLWRSRGKTAHVVLLAAVTIGSLVAVIQVAGLYDLGATRHPLDLERLGTWLHVLVYHPWVGRPSWVLPLVYTVVVVGGVACLVTGRARWLVVVVLLVLTTGWKAVSDFVRSEIAGNFAMARYDILAEALLLVAAGEVVGRAVEALRWVAGRFTGTIHEAIPGTVAAAVVLVLLVGGTDHYTERLHYQAEFELLVAALDDQPDDCAVVTVWQDGGAGTTSFDTGLAVPHPLLQFDAPGRTWLALGEATASEPLPTEQCRLAFLGSFCQLDGGFATSEGDPQATETIARAKASCACLAAETTAPLAQETVPGLGLYWPFEDGTVTLDLAPLPPEADVGACRWSP